MTKTQKNIRRQKNIPLSKIPLAVTVAVPCGTDDTDADNDDEEEFPFICGGPTKVILPLA